MSSRVMYAPINSCADSPDVFVVGGGPAGLAMAILARQHGLRVTLADHNRPPIDKACGEGLMPDTLAAMEALGVTFAVGEAVPFRGIRFCHSGGTPCVEAEFGQRSGLGLRRTVLHAKLAQRAAQVGVTLRWGSRIDLGGSGEIFCEGRRVTCKWVVGADGEASLFRKWAALHRTCYEQIRFSSRQHFRMAPWSDFAEVYWARDCQIVVAPVAADELCVAVTSRNPLLRFREAIATVPVLACRLGTVGTATPVRGARAAVRRLKSVCHGRFALIGDASGSVDPLTGEGIGLAFRQAAALVDAIKSNDLQAYQAAHDRIGRATRLISRLMLAMDAYPHFCERALRMLSAEPHLFSRLLHVNVGELAISRFGLGHALRLGWRMLTPGWEL